MSAVPESLHEHLTGEITGIVYRNEENAWSVLRLSVKGHRGPVTVTGATLAREGEIVNARGFWKKDPRFGQQFAAESIVASKPTSPKAIERYLASGVVKGIGEATAKRLVAKFGADTLKVMEETPDRLSEVQGVGKALIEKVKANWEEQRAAQAILLFLAGHEVGGATAMRIYKAYGADAIAVIQANPYRLANEIRGIGFLTADGIARQLGVPENSAQRVEAGIRYAIRELTTTGHCGLQVDDFVDKCADLLKLHARWIDPVLDTMLESQDALVPVRLGGEDLYVFERRLFEAEKRIAHGLRDMLTRVPPWAVSQEQAERIASDAARDCGVELAPEQYEAVVMALRSRLSVLTGGPGTGKTSTLKAILAALKRVRARVVMGAPTGKAAKRMNEATNHQASTVARLIGMGQQDEGDRTIECDILVIDEASMVDTKMLDRVLACLEPGAALLFVGDVDQLPSVGPGRVLGDMIESGAIPTTRLTQVFRQAATSAIVRNAHRINRGESIEPTDAGADFFFIGADSPEVINEQIVSLVAERLPAKFGLRAEDIQVLSPMRRTPTGTQNLNALLQEAVNPQPQDAIKRGGIRFAIGDRVIHTQNNYELGSRGVMNGESGIIREIDRTNDIVRIEIDDELVDYGFADLEQLDLAYAMTVHKSQGSQFPAVIVPVTTQHFTMLQRSIIYTAITRASRLCVLVGQRRALEMAIRNSRTEPRVTSLLYRLESGK